METEKKIFLKLDFIKLFSNELAAKQFGFNSGLLRIQTTILHD